MRRLEPRLFLNAGALVVIVLLAANVVVFAAWTRPRLATADATGAGDELERARQIIEPRLRRAEATYGRAAAALDDLEALHELAADLDSGADVMAAVQAAADQVGLEVEQIGFQPGLIEPLGLVELGLTVPVRGSYVAVREMLDALTRGSGFFAVQAVALASTDPGQGGVSSSGRDLNVDLVVSSFLDAGAGPVGGLDGAGERPLPSADSAAPGLASPVEVARRLVERLDRLPPLPVDPDALRLRLAALDREGARVPAPSRNLFASFTPPPRVAPAEPVAEPEPVEPPFRYRLLGIVQVDGVRRASLTDGTELVLAARGATLPNGFQVVDVGRDYAELAAGERHVRLVLEESGS